MIDTAMLLGVTTVVHTVAVETPPSAGVTVLLVVTVCCCIDCGSPALAISSFRACCTRFLGRGRVRQMQQQQQQQQQPQQPQQPQMLQPPSQRQLLASSRVL